jgi:hypothetical protein
MNPVNIFPSHFFNIHFNIILLRMLRSPKCYRSDFPNKILYSFLSAPTLLNARPSHPLSFGLPNHIWWRVQTVQLLIVQLSPTSCHFLSLRSKYSRQPPVLKRLQSTHGLRPALSNGFKWVRNFLPRYLTMETDPVTETSNLKNTWRWTVFRNNNNVCDSTPLPETFRCNSQSILFP